MESGSKLNLLTTYIWKSQGKQKVSGGWNRNKRQKVGNLYGQVPITSCHHQKLRLWYIVNKPYHHCCLHGLSTHSQNKKANFGCHFNLAVQLTYISQINVIIFRCEWCASHCSNKRTEHKQGEGESLMVSDGDHVSFLRGVMVQKPRNN